MHAVQMELFYSFAFQVIDCWCIGAQLILWIDLIPCNFVELIS